MKFFGRGLGFGLMLFGALGLFSFFCVPAAHAADTTPPSVPTSLSATAISSSQVNLAWAVSTDNVAVTGYDVYRNGTKVGTAASNAYSDATAAASTTYSYVVAAYDAAGNVSAQSASVNVTTPAVGILGTPIPDSTWTMVPTNGFPEAIVGYDNLVYAPGVKKFLMWDNYHNMTSESNQAYDMYNFSTNRWDIVGLGGDYDSQDLSGSGHPVGMLQYDPSNSTFYYYGSFSGSQQYESSREMYQFDPVGIFGRDLQTPTFPGDVAEASAVFDVQDNVYVLFDRGTGTWIYSPATNAFTKMSPNGTPPNTVTDSAGYFSGMTYDGANDEIYLFGGSEGGGVYSNDLYSYSVPSNTWTKLSPSGTLPSARQYPGFAYDATDNIILMMGGEDSSDASTNLYLNDTWVYSPTANSWTELNPSQSPPVLSGFTAFQRLAYDPDDNVFVLTWPGLGGYVGAQPSGYGDVQTWFFRYAGTGNNVGYAGNPSYTPTSGSLNRNANAWADEPQLVSNGSTLYAGWIETGVPLASGNDLYPHPFASQLSGSTWTSLGSSYLALDSEFSGDDEGHDPAMAVVGSTPWISWNKESNNGQLLPDSLYAKYWNAASSTWVGGPVGVVTSGPSDTAGYSAITGVGSTPYIAFLEIDRSCFPYCNEAYVKSWNGSAWNLVGTGMLNRNASSSSLSPHAASISIASDGIHPYVAWTEFTVSSTLQSNTPPQAYVDEWNGSVWVPLGGSLNINSGDSSYGASIVYLSGEPYVAWTERSQTGNNQVFVKAWNGSAWSLVGSGTLNRNTGTGWAEDASLVADPNTGNLYLGWIEQSAIGQKAQTYVDRYSSGAWTTLGGTLNADAVNGSAEDVSVAVLNGEPVAAWGEVAYGSLRNVYAKEWNGSAWVSAAGSIVPSSDTTPPTISLTSPVNNAAASGTVSVAASAADNVGVTSVQFFVDGVSTSTDFAAPYAYSLNTANLTNGPHTLYAEAYDSAGNVGISSVVTITVSNGAADTTPPSVPTSLSATAASASQVNLAWSASTDNVLVTGYSIYRGGTQIATSSATSYADMTVAASTAYTYNVAAYDAAGNVSAQSAAANATTPSSGLVVSGIPSTWNTGHPRLPHPDNAYLLALASDTVEMAKYNAAAAAFDPTNPTSNMGQFRRALIAYLANQAAGNTALAATDLTKFEELANLGGTWAQLLYAVNDGVGTGGYTLTSASANFLTGCDGGTCANGNYTLSIEGRGYDIISATANTIVLAAAANPPITGTGLPIRIFNGGQEAYVGIRMAMVYDWLYNDLDTADRTAFMDQLEVYADIFEEDYVGLGASPYNDQVYIETPMDAFIAAFAIYPDFDVQNPTGGQCTTKPCGTYHMNWMINKLFNVFVPVWHQEFGMNGGAWSEDWSQYTNANPGLDQYLVPILLSWQSASGQPYFAENPWLKNFATWTMYATRPDFTMEHIGEVSAGTLTPEYNIDYDEGVGLGSLNGLAEIYNDPTLRGWARLVNQEFPAGPSGFEPSAWPFYTPDNESNPVTTRAVLPTSKDFDGWGVVFARSGWTENDTDVSLKYGDDFWSHTHADAGSFTISHRGNLAIDSGTYRAGSNSEEEVQYGRQSISQNTLLIVDPNDYYPSQSFSEIITPTTTISMPLANDGGQRRAGTFYNQLFPQYVSPDCLNKAFAPGCVDDWQSEYDYYHMGTLLAYSTTPQYTYASIDITPSYNNPESVTTPNSTNRTDRAESVIRNMLFIPRGTDAYVIIYDEVNSTNAAFEKKWLLHSINQPIVSGNRYEIDRTENVSESLNWTNPYLSQLAYANGGTGAGAKYQYNGKLVGWMISPTGGTISTIGGPGQEFWIVNPQTGVGTNYNECQQGQCSGAFWGFLDQSTIPDILTPNPDSGPIEPGSWRIEETPSTQENQDYFLNVMLATDANDTNVPASVTGTSSASNLGATWSDASNTYTISFPKTGTGGTLTITGAVNLSVTLASSTGGSGPSTDTTPPSVPTGLSATAASATSVNLSWTASTDNVGVAGYDIYRNGVLVGNSIIPSYADSGLAGNTSYSYTVAAYDAAGNLSAQSRAAAATTPALLPTISNLLGSGILSSSVVISWNTNVLTNGQVFYGTTAAYGFASALVDNAPQTTSHAVTLTGLAPVTLYHFKVTSVDTSNNVTSSSDFTFTTSILSILGGGSSPGNGGGNGNSSNATSAPVIVYIPPVATSSLPLPSPASSTAPLAPVTTASPSASSITALLYPGVSGESSQVAALQDFLEAQGYLKSATAGGVFDASTESALEAFQCAQKIVCSGTPATTGYGQAGPKTRSLINSFATASSPAAPSSAPLTHAQIEALIQSLTAQLLNLEAELASLTGNANQVSTAPTALPPSALSITIQPSASTTSAASPTLGPGSKGAAVAALQNALVEQGFLSSGTFAAATFDEVTLRAVENFQCANSIACSASDPGYGIVGPKTKTVLGL